jgi:AraC family transcriptional regulator
MIPTIQTFAEKRLIGKKLTMSFAQNITPQLWQSFMPQRGEITNAAGTDLYSVQNYPENFFEAFNPTVPFEKWAALEVANFDTIPDRMETFTIPSGLYAVFYYQGNPNYGAEVFRYILQEWLPQSGYRLDTRPHFEILGEKYKNGQDDSEEEIWIPIKS